MENWKNRTVLLIGEKAQKKLSDSTVAVIGLGGVGGMCAEALCRTGVGGLILCDYDTVDETNLNRQIFTTREWIGKLKTDAALSRIKAINPDCNVKIINKPYNLGTRELLFNTKPNYVADAIDMVTSKLDLIKSCKEHDVPVISCMGAGNRLDPTAFCVADIFQTKGCGLARTIRRELRKSGVADLKVVHSTELAKKIITGKENGRHPPASIMFCPNSAGLIMASEIINDLIIQK